jgi:hypothetical protein
MTFSEDIKAIDSCRVCHSGPEYHVEIDVVIDGDTPLWRAHDIAQDLQDQLEALPNINRCFVHIDHETEHKPVSIFMKGWLMNEGGFRGYLELTPALSRFAGTSKACLESGLCLCIDGVLTS